MEKYTPYNGVTTGRKRRFGSLDAPDDSAKPYDGPNHQELRVVIDMLYAELYREVYQDVTRDLCDELGTAPPNEKLFVPSEKAAPAYFADSKYSWFQDVREYLYERLYVSLMRDLRNYYRFIFDARGKKKSDKPAGRGTFQ